MFFFLLRFVRLLKYSLYHVQCINSITHTYILCWIETLKWFRAYKCFVCMRIMQIYYRLTNFRKYLCFAHRFYKHSSWRYPYLTIIFRLFHFPDLFFLHFYTKLFFLFSCNFIVFYNEMIFDIEVRRYIYVYENYCYSSIILCLT